VTQVALRLDPYAADLMFAGASGICWRALPHWLRAHSEPVWRTTEDVRRDYGVLVDLIRAHRQPKSWLAT